MNLELPVLTDEEVVQMEKALHDLNSELQGDSPKPK
jgi:hypothetical protein